jgi:hypothetical protein
MSWWDFERVLQGMKREKSGEGGLYDISDRGWFDRML